MTGLGFSGAIFLFSYSYVIIFVYNTHKQNKKKANIYRSCNYTIRNSSSLAPLRTYSSLGFPVKFILVKIKTFLV